MAQLMKIGKVYYSDYRENGKRVRRALSTEQAVAQDLLNKILEVRWLKKEAKAGRLAETLVLLTNAPADMIADIKRRYSGCLKAIIESKRTVVY